MNIESHVLVCLSSSPSNQRIIREAGRLAASTGSRFTALFVKTPQFRNWSKDNIQRLDENTAFAQSLGANIETVFGEDVAFQIAKFAGYSGVTMLVIGRSVPSRMHRFGRPTLTDRLIELLPDMDIHIIPDSTVASKPMPEIRSSRILGLSLKDILVSLLILLASTGICFSLFAMNLSRANLIAVYILGAVLISIRTDYRIYSYIASIASVALFNYFFTEPRFSLLASEQEYPVTFLVMFLVSVLTGSLVSRLKEQAVLSAEAAFRTRVLLEANQELLHAETPDDIRLAVQRQTMRITGQDTKILQKDSPDADSADPGWVRFPFHSPYNDYGVLLIKNSGSPLPASLSGLIQSILGEAALALDNEYNRQEKEQATLLAQKEKFRFNTLRTISHDLRTPLTSILGNSDYLIRDGNMLDDRTKETMYADIRSDAQWLIDLVENLLSVSRMEEGQIQLRLSAELISDVIEEALRHIDRSADSYIIRISQEDELLMAMMDTRLIVQVLINLLNNAIRHTEPGTEIEVRTRRTGDWAEITVADNGNGIPEGEEEKIFEMFYSSNATVSDSRRSMGLGLSLCRSAVSAHGGTLTAFNVAPHGAAFCFTLPVKEVRIHE